MELIFNNKKLIGGILLVTVFIFSAVYFFEAGYRLSIRGIMSPTTVVLNGYDVGMNVLFDETVLPPAALVGTGASRTITVPSGDHAIALTRDRYLPWLKQMYLPPGEEIRLSVFMFPQFTNGVVLLEKDEEYKTGQAAIAQTSTPTEQTPLVSQDEPIEVFIRDNTLVARFVGEGNPPAYFCANAEDPCDNEHIALTFDAEVRGVAFWPGHEGVLFIAVQDGVFAFEMDTRGRQNFQPIYRGIRPNFGLAGGAFYISDSTSLFKISFVPGN